MYFETSMAIPSFDQADELFQLSPLFEQDDQLFQLDFDMFDNIEATPQQQPQDGNPTGTTTTTTTTNEAATTDKAAAKRRRQRDSATAPRNGSEDKNPNDNKKKKIIHRDTERQRRQEMATLYSSLRSQLPFAYLKGKRSISDHIHQAVGYIKHLHNKIHDLNEKRDGLKSSLADSTTPTRAPERPPSRSGDTVVVKSSAKGVEVAVNTDSKMGIALSKVIGILLTEGLNVSRCNSAKVNERMFHSIEAETGNGSASENMCNELQEKLMRLLFT